MELTLITKVLDHTHVDASRHEILVALICVIHVSNFEVLDNLKDKLVATKLYGFTVHNVEL